MHDIKIIRKNFDLFTKKISERGVKADLNDLLGFDKKNRDLIQIKEKLEQEKKTISQKKDKDLFRRSKEISVEIDKINKDQIKVKDKLDFILSSLPNLALDDVPIGKDETKNKEVAKNGKIKEFDFKPLSHDQIGKKLNHSRAFYKQKNKKTACLL